MCQQIQNAVSQKVSIMDHDQLVYGDLDLHKGPIALHHGGCCTVSSLFPASELLRPALRACLQQAGLCDVFQMSTRGPSNAAWCMDC